MYNDFLRSARPQQQLPSNPDDFQVGSANWFLSYAGYDFAKEEEEREMRRLQREAEAAAMAEGGVGVDDEQGRISRMASGIGDFGSAVGETIARPFSEWGEGFNELVDDFTGTTAERERRTRELHQRREESALAIQEKLKDPMLPREEREKYLNFLEMIAEDLAQEGQEAQRRADMTDPSRQAANVGEIGVNVLSGGALTGVRAIRGTYTAAQGVRGARTGRLARARDIGGYETAARGAARGGGEALALGAADSTARQYAINDGEIDPQTFLIDTLASGVIGGAMGGVAGGISARQAGRRGQPSVMDTDGVDTSATRLADDLDAEDAFLASQRTETPLMLDGGEGRIRRELAQIEEEMAGLQRGEAPQTTVRTGTTPQENVIRKRDLSTSDARRSPEVTPEEFRGYRERGRKKVEELKKNSAEPKALTNDKQWKGIVDDAYTESRSEWGGITVDARTGKKVAGDADAYALTVRDPGMDTVSIAPTEGKVAFRRAMNEAREKYKEILSRKDSHLGVFYDGDTGMVEIDPVYITRNLDDVHDIGAYTNATGGAYHFKSGDGFWPPHVADNAAPVRDTIAGDARITKGGTVDQRSGRDVGVMTGEGSETVTDSKLARQRWQELQDRKNALEADLILASAPENGAYTTRLTKTDVSTPGKAAKKSGKAAEKRIEAIPTKGYKGALSDTITSFGKNLQGGLKGNEGGNLVTRIYEKVVGGLATRNENRRLMAKAYNATIQKSNAWKRKNGRAVGDALRNVSDEDMGALTAREIARKYGINEEIASVAQKTRRHFQEMLDQVNEARILRGEDPVPYRSEYMPQWGKGASRVSSENRFFSDVVSEYEARFARERTGAPRDFERNIFKVMDEYHSQVANEIHLNPIIRDLNDLADGVAAPTRNAAGEIIAPGNTEGADWIRNYISEGLLNRSRTFDKVGGSKGFVARAVERMIIARSLSGLAGNIRWMVFTQPQTIGVSAGQHGWRNTFMGTLDAIFDPNVRRQIQDLEVYRLKRSQSVGATAGGQLDRLESSVMKTRREFANDLMTTPSNYVEAAMDSISAAAALRKAKQLNLTPEQTRNMMNHGIEVTQSVYAAEMRADILRNSLVRASFPFQTYSTEMWRHVRNLTKGPASGMAYEGNKAVFRRLGTATSMIAAIALGNHLQKQVTGTNIASPGSAVPLVGEQVDAATDWVTNEFGFLPDTDFSFADSPSLTAFESDFEDLWDAIKGYVASDDDGDFDALRTQLVRWGMGLGGLGGAATVNRWIDSVIALEQGYIETASGREIPIDTGPANVARALSAGRWSTPEGQEYIENQRGLLTESQYENVMGPQGDGFEAVYSELRNMRTEKRNANDEINELLESGNINKARRRAMEFNVSVDARLMPILGNFEITPELLDAVNEYKVGEEIHHLKRRSAAQ